MTAVEDALSRPEFETADLDVGVAEADRTIEEAMKGLATSEADHGRNYRTTDGMLVAVLAPRPSGSGDVKATLAYRTAPAADAATRKARRLAEALADHTIDA